MSRIFLFCFLVLVFAAFSPCAFAQENASQSAALSDGVQSSPTGAADIFDDKVLIQGYAAKLASAPKDLLLAMINDEGLSAYKKAAAVRVFREKFALQMVSSERTIVERVLLRQMQRAGAVYQQIEIMHALIIMDRYRYFDSMVPLLVQKMDHYDAYVNELAYEAVENINASGTQRAREARVVLNTLRKVFFLSRKKLQNADPQEPKLRNKLQLLRWAIKILGTEELKALPSEVISLM